MAWSKKRMILALLCAALAALSMGLYASGVRAQAAQSREQALAAYGGEQVEVFVATRDIAAGETLGSGNVSRQIWLSDLLPVGTLRDAEEVYGQVAAVGLLCNEPVVAAKLGAVAASVSIPEGYCAVTIPTDEVLAVGGSVCAGSVVLIYAAGPQSVDLLSEEVLVLATSNGAQIENDSGSGLFGSGSSRTRAALSWVTLAIEPHRVQELIAASRDKNLYLVLPGAGIGIEDLEVDGGLAADTLLKSGGIPAGPTTGTRDQTEGPTSVREGGVGDE